MRFLYIFLLLLFPGLATAEPAFDYGAFAQMPVLAEGRVKPLDSLARVLLARIHGGEEYEGGSASAWLAFVCFSPEEAMKSPLFHVKPQAAQMLGLQEVADHYYRFEELASVLPQRSEFIAGLERKDKSALTSEESEILHVYGATNDFAALVGSFSLILPLTDVENSTRAKLALPAQQPVSYLDLQKYRQALDDAVQAITAHKGTKPETYTPDERALVRLGMHLALLEEANRDNTLLRVIPPPWGGEEWLSPWGVLASSAGSPQDAQLLRDWRALAQSYRSNDIAAWDGMSRRLLDESLAAIEPSAAWRLMLEYYYHKLDLLTFAACAYVMGLALAAFGRLTPGRVFLLAGMALHAAALSMRIAILLRPPVSTLYESLIFVSFVVAAVSYGLASRRNSTPTLLAGGFTALLLLLASRVFAGDGDTLGVLVAVLNTNFWLATHVICITTGYGCALVTGAIAHIWLFRRAAHRASDKALAPVTGLLYPASLLALLFTSVGTMLGGIWADQSWGRFWGWDPKENGALLIVLWLIWVLHGRIAGQIAATGFAALLALTNIVVALAWVGVNLLSVGLHSYGFTDTAADGLIVFCATELAFVGTMLLIMRLRRAAAPDAMP